MPKKSFDKKSHDRKSKKSRIHSKKESGRPADVESDSESDEMVYGRNPVLETLRSERDVNKLFVQDGLSGEKIDRVVSEAKKRKVQLSFVPKNKLDT
ncbi:MAG: 23S rRNA (guanosine(2251)-2'-O)-methyltransferase RlmB, partial [Alkalibacterium sp.]|nr:23S rRNA (guanosine(2251)-2'-O)-methyltransferase RlmB [Alkalibacterium sp.]